MHPAKRLFLATAAIVASRSTTKETRRAGIATPRRFAEPTRCPRNMSDTALVVALAYRAAASPRKQWLNQFPLLIRQQLLS
jgi:hypothetical protein